MLAHTPQDAVTICRVAVFAGARATRPTAEDDLTFAELAQEIALLCAHESNATNKTELPAFVPARLTPDATRSTAAVETMSAVCMLDLDGVDLAALRARIKELGVAAIVHGTPSDDPAHAARKMRAYVALDREHAPDDAKAVRLAVADLLGVEADPATLDPARLGFCGRLKGTAPRECYVFGGSPVSVDALPRRAPASAPREAPAPAPDARPDAARNAALCGIVGALGSWGEYPGRKHATVGAVAGILRRGGFAATDAEAWVRLWLPADVHGVDVDAAVRWALKSWEKTTDEVSGRAALDAIVGPSVGAAIEQAAMLPWRARREAPPEPGAAPVGPAGAPVAADWRQVRFSDPVEPIVYACHGLALAPSKGKISVIAGQPGAGKGPLADHVAICLATGAPVFGAHACQRMRVLLLDFEGVRLTLARLRRMAYGMHVDPLALDGAIDIIDTCEATEPLSDAWQAKVAEHVRARGIGAVVVDSYTSAMMTTDIEPNSPRFAIFARLLARLDVLVIAVTHANKASSESTRPRLTDMLGTGALGALAQTALIVQRPDADDSSRVRITCSRSPEHRFEPFDVEFCDTDDRRGLTVALAPPLEQAHEAPEEPAKPRQHDRAIATREAALRMMRVLSDRTRDMSRAELGRRSGESASITNRALALLEERGLIQDHAGRFEITDAGAAATPREIAAALGGVAGFAR
jgi:hypothetical protein